MYAFPEGKWTLSLKINAISGDILWDHKKGEIGLKQSFVDSSNLNRASKLKSFYAELCFIITCRKTN